jgi:hypothetical protein
MISYVFQSPSGIPGDISRTDGSSVEPAMLVSPFPANYGVAVKYATGPGGTGITPFVAADTAAVVAGLLTRAAPGISQSNTAEAVNTFQPNQSEPQNLMKRGYATVFVNSGTPVRGQPVGIVQTASAGHPAGAFETGVTGNNIPLTATICGNWTWASDGVDAFGNGEIRIAQ